jgi:hypothetical protein
LEEAAKAEFMSIIKSENIEIHWRANDELDTIGNYVETWRIVLWDHFFKGCSKTFFIFEV